MSEEENPPILQGSPETIPEAPAPEAPPITTVDYEIGGKTYKLDPELFDALKSRPVEAASPPPAPVVEATPPRDPMEDLDNLWYTRPKDAYQLMREQIISDMRSEYAAVQTRNQLWSSFYAKNPDLADAKPFVENVWQRHSSRLGTMDVERGLKELAKTTRDELVAATRSFGNTTPTAPALAEGSTSPSPLRVVPTPEPQHADTLSAAIRARREARRRALTESRAMPNTSKG